MYDDIIFFLVLFVLNVNCIILKMIGLFLKKVKDLIFYNFCCFYKSGIYVQMKEFDFVFVDSYVDLIFYYSLFVVNIDRVICEIFFIFVMGNEM